MDLETAQITTTVKLPTLKQGEYDLWRLRIEQYFQIQDYALWDVIENGNSFKPAAKTITNAYGTSTTLILGPVTTEEKVQKKNNMKARTTKKTQKTLLKQMFENFSAPSTESVDSIFNRLQKIKTSRKITINGSDTTGYDKSKAECFNYHKLGHFAREYRGPRNQDSKNRNQDSSRRTINVEETSSKTMLAIDEAGLFLPPNLDLSNSGLEEFQQPEFKGYGPKTSKNVSEDTSNDVRESFDAPLVEELVSNDKKKTVFPTVAKIKFVRPKQQEKPVRKPVKYAEMYRSQGLRGNQRNWNNQKPQQQGSNFVMYNKACFVCGSFDHVQANCNYHQRERVVSGNNYSRVNYNYYAKKAHPSAHRNITPRAVLIKTGLRPLNTARPVNTAHPKTTVYSARPMSRFSKSTQSTVKRPYQTRTTLTNKNFSQKVNTAKGNFYIARPKAVNTARPNSAVVNAVRENQTSRNMMDDMLPLGEELKEEKLLVKELLKLMCDKKNSVLFTDTTCFVLSPDSKLTDESQVLLKVPRKNNMYSVDMKNIVPKESLTCLVVKATIDESILWHRRLGHVNIKTINKLVKENIVRGLPIKCFENNQTCVAYLKGKQHKAFCKSKIQNSITQTLFMLHMDLFGLTFVSSLMNKKYCLVVTDDYSRFTWVFFLASKDETSGILKRFITEIENLVDKKVKIIRCDYGTEFKNRVMSEFCKKKGIMREFSVARTPQQNGVVERRNRTLIEAARTINDEPQPSNDAGKKDDEGGIDDQERTENSAQDVNTCEDLPTTLLESTYAGFFGDESELDLSNIATTYPVPTTPNTRIHKDHSLDHVLGRAQEGNPSWIEANKKSFCNSNYNKFGHWWIYLMSKGPLEQNRCTETRKMREMDVNSAFLYGKIKEEVYVYQPPGFEDLEFLDKVYKVEKALYGLHQALRAFQEYVDDIIFGSTKKELCTDFEKLMHKKFQMSSIGELTFFLGLQVTQKDDGIFINQDKYMDEILKKFGFSTMKTTSTPMET
ncbi:putative ribonuclease H-like domain-containing protein [Tanacetum coccineum]